MIRLFQIICLLLCIYSTAADAQNLSGTWEGRGGVETITIVLLKCGNKYVGYSYDRDALGFCKTNIEAVYDDSTKKLKITSKSFIEHSLNHAQTNYNLNYSTEENTEYLKGVAFAKGALMKLLSFGMSFPVTLSKLSDDIDTTPFMAKALKAVQPAAPPPTATIVPANLPDSTPVNQQTDSTIETKSIIRSGTERKTVIIKTITTTAKKINITVYDNGVADGDSISILHNQTIIANRIPVSLQRQSFDIFLDDPSAPQLMILVAHNLGSIPPNTATIEIIAGTKKYTLAASADLTTNAAIRFVYGED